MEGTIWVFYFLNHIAIYDFKMLTFVADKSLELLMFWVCIEFQSRNLFEYKLREVPFELEKGMRA